MSFGYGVGDLIAVSELTKKAYDCIQVGIGSAADYQALKLIRDHLGTTLEQVELQITNSGRLSKPEENAIKQHLQHCSQHLAHFDEKTQKYIETLSSGAWWNRYTLIRAGYRGLQWNDIKNGLREIFREFHENFNAIGVLWQLSTGCVLPSTITDCNTDWMGFSCSRTLELINTQSDQICTALQRIEKNVLPKGVDRFPDYKPIRFTDALERNILIPYEWCVTWQVT
jgi:hypothetical protein